ncbi:MAG TPA: hypothetical protein VGE37_05845, partial [Archangium sp.]
PPTPPVKPAVMPVIALVLGVLGFCLPPLFLVAVVLAIVSLVKASEPAYAARKTLAIITLVMGVVYVPVVGILAAIAIPNFIKFQARSKQTECKVNLRMALTAQQAYFSANEAWGDTAEEIGFALDGKNRYSYRVAENTIIPAAVTTISPQDLEAAFPAGVFDSEDGIVLGCAGNIDNDKTVDVWTISSAQRTVDGELVPAGTPHQHVDDVRD